MIYFDVSTLRMWKGPPVGITRTSVECARWLLHNASPSVVFCAFDAASAALFQVDQGEVQALIRSLERNDSPPPAQANSVRRRGSGDGLAMLPRKALQRLRSFYWSAARRMRKAAAERSIRASESSDRDNNLRYTRVALTEKDVYVSVGLDWDVGQLPHIRRLKEQARFKVLLMCYDVIPIKYPHLCLDRVSQGFPKYMSDLANVADHVICISETTQKDFETVLAALGCPAARTSVIKVGAHLPPVGYDGCEDVPAVLHDRPFILYVSTVERRKNHEVLYKAYVRLREAGISGMPIMAFVGMVRTSGVQELLNDIASDPRIQGDFLILNRVADSSLGWLYRHCLFTVFPSLYEGWGIPVEESLAFGKFCLASNRGALPEAGGDLVEYLDPWDTVAWAEALRKYSSDPQLLKQREARIKSRFVARTWDQFGAALFREAQALVMPSTVALTA